MACVRPALRPRHRSCAAARRPSSHRRPSTASRCSASRQTGLRNGPASASTGGCTQVQRRAQRDPAGPLVDHHRPRCRPRSRSPAFSGSTSCGRFAPSTGRSATSAAEPSRTRSRSAGPPTSRRLAASSSGCERACSTSRSSGTDSSATCRTSSRLRSRSIREGTILLLDGAVGPIDDNQREVASILRENALRLQQLIENLLSYSAWKSRASSVELTSFRLELAGRHRD